MPIVEAIQIKLSLQTVGQEAIKQFTQQIQNLAKIPVNINLSSAFNTSAASLAQAIEKQMPSITNAISTGVAQAIDDVSQRVKQMFGALESDVKKKQGLISSVLLGDNFQTSVAWLSTGFVAQLKLITALQDQVGSNKSFAQAAYSAFNEQRLQYFSNIFEKLIPMFKDAGNQILRFLNIGKEINSVLDRGGNLLQVFQASFSALAAGITGLFTTTGYFFFSGLFFKEATQFIYRFFGIQQQLTLLDRINRIVMTIDKALHSMHLTVGMIFKSTATGVAAFASTIFGFLNPFNTIITKLAFANTLVTAVSTYLEKGRLRFAAFFGSSTAQIRLAFINVRTFFLALTHDFDYLGGGIMKKGLSIAAFLGSKGAKLQLAILKYREFFMFLANQLPKIMTMLSGALSKVPDASKIGNLQKGISLTTQSNQQKALPTTQKPLALPSPTIAQQPATTLQLTIQKAADVVREAAQKVVLGLTTNRILQLPNSVQRAGTINLPDQTKKAIALPDLRTETERIRQEMLALLLRLKSMGVPLQDLAVIFDKMRTITIANSYRQQKGNVSEGQVSNWAGQRASIPEKYVTGSNLQTIKKAFEEQLFAIKPAIYLKYGNEILREIARGIRSNPVILQQATAKALQPIDDQLPHSPAKTGPLRTLRESGSKIFSELAIGMNNGVSVAKEAVTKVTKAIARFFPHSPAEEGPLRGLRQWGQGILSQLSLGISDKLQSVLNLFFNLANQIKATLKPVLEMSFMGERMGVNVQTVSLLEYAFAGFEVQASEVQMTMNSLNRTLAEVATPEKLAALSQVGINLQEIRKAANPATEFVFQLADALDRFPMSSDKMIKALEAMGLSAQSNLINGLAQGSSKIKEQMAEGIKLGAAYEESFVKAGHSFTELMNKIDKIWEILEREFAVTLMPIIDNLARKMFNFYKENSTQIRAIVRVAGESIGILIEMISNATTLAWQNPTAFKDAFLGILTWLYQSAGTLWNTFLEDSMNGITSHVWLFVKHTVWGALKATGNMMSQVLVAAWNRFILFVVSELKSFVGKLASLNLTDPILKVLGLPTLGGKVEELLAPLDQLAADAGKSTKFSIEDALWKAADENRKIMEEARKASGEEWQKMQDPETIKRTVERFEQSFREISDRFSGALQGTGFDKILTNGMERLTQALSQGNLEAAQDVIENINESMQSLNDGVVQVGNNIKMTLKEQATEAAEEAKRLAEMLANAGTVLKELNAVGINISFDELKNSAESAAKKAEDLAKQVSNTAQQELKSLADKILGMQLDMQVRIAKSDDERKKAQRKKDLLDLQTKQNQELVEYQKLLYAKLIQDQEYANQHIAFATLDYDKQLEYIRNLDEYKQFIESQKAERKKKSEDERKDGKYFTQDQEDFLTTWQGTFNTLGTAFGNMYEMMGEKAVAFFYLQKGVAIADATITGAMATLNAYEAGMKAGGEAAGPTVAAIFAAIAAAAAASQIGVITAQTIQGPTAMATGGIVPGTGNKDTVPIMATPGEFVIPKEATAVLQAKYGRQIIEGLRLGYLNLDRAMPRQPANTTLSFAAGGTVPNLTIQQGQQAQSQQQQPAINVINIVDPNEIDRYLASSRGQTTIVNVIQKNANKVSKILR